MGPWEGFSQGFSSGFENAKERKLKEMMAMQLSPYQAGALQNDQAALQLQRDKLANPEPTTAMQNYQYLISQGVSPKEAALAAFATPYTATPTFNSIGNPAPVGPQPDANPVMSKEQQLQEMIRRSGKNAMGLGGIFQRKNP